MERRHAAPLWRASLGVVVTAIAAALLIFAVWRVLWLNNQAGNTLSQLSRERTAVAYQRTLFELLWRMERFRVQTELLRNPPFKNDLRQAVDAQMSVAANFTASRAESFDVAEDWSAIQRRWSKARNLERVYRGPQLQRLTRAVDDLIYKVEDTSGIQYESNRYAQDLGDIVFAKTPEAVHDAMYADLVA